MLKACFIISALIIFTTAALAQKRTISGYLKDSLTHLPVPGNITNATTKKKIETDINGFFYIEASNNDVLYATALHYKFDTIRYSSMLADTLIIFLAPTGVLLQNVTVETGYEKYRMDSLERRKEFESSRISTFNTVAKSRSEGFGLIINLDRFFKKEYKNKRKEERIFSNMEKQAYINFRFPKQLVALYTGLKGDELLSFMRQYGPSYEWLRANPYREQLVYFISDQFKAYRNTTGKSKKAL